MARKKAVSDMGNFYLYSGLIQRGGIYDFKNKENAVKLENSHMLNILLKMFEYDGLPDTIPQHILELLTLTNGYCYITDKYDGSLYAYRCTLGGTPDEYYIPKEVIINNPYQRYNATLDREKDGVLFNNDPLYIGVLPLLNKYNTLIVETNITVDLLIKLSRAVALISASDDGTKQSAEKFIKDIIDGKYGIIGETAFLDGVKNQPLSNSSQHNHITQLIELMNYLDSKKLNSFGLQSNHNMKRESINEAEAGLNEKALLPYVDIMLKQREENVKKINNMFGTSISVKLSSSWELQHIECTHDNNVKEDEIIEDVIDEGVE